MAALEEDGERLLGLLRTDEAFRAAVRREILTDELLALPGRVTELESRLTEQIGALADQMRQLAEQVGRLAERLDTLVTIVQRHEGDLGDLKGELFEFKLQRNPGAFLAAVIRRNEAIGESTLYELAGDDADELVRADLVVRGRLVADGQPAYGVVEASRRAHIDDVERALRRASGLAQATGDRVVAITVSQQQPAEVVIETAEELGVGRPPWRCVRIGRRRASAGRITAHTREQSLDVRWGHDGAARCVSGRRDQARYAAGAAAGPAGVSAILPFRKIIQRAFQLICTT